MEEKIKELDNKDLMMIYKIILEHLEYLENEKAKVEEGESKND